MDILTLIWAIIWTVNLALTGALIHQYLKGRRTEREIRELQTKIRQLKISLAARERFNDEVEEALRNLTESEPLADPDQE